MVHLTDQMSVPHLLSFSMRMLWERVPKALLKFKVGDFHSPSIKSYANKMATMKLELNNPMLLN